MDIEEQIHYTRHMLRYIRQEYPETFNEALRMVKSISGEIIDIDKVHFFNSH